MFCERLVQAEPVSDKYRGRRHHRTDVVEKAPDGGFEPHRIVRNCRCSQGLFLLAGKALPHHSNAEAALHREVYGGTATHSRTPLIGRGPQLQELERLYAGASQGEGALVLVWGEAGVGKTRL